MKIAVYTAIFGDYDSLIPQPKLENVDYICFTDRPKRSKLWDVRVVKPLYEEDHTRNNRYFKILPHQSLQEYEWSIYIDGNFLLLKPVDSLLEYVMDRGAMGAFCHSPPADRERNCIYEEYNYIKTFLDRGIELDDPEVLEDHIRFLRNENYPDHNGLIAGGVLVRKHNDRRVRETMELWWQMVRERSKRDQLSFNYAAWKTGMDFSYIPGEICEGNPWFYKLGGHRQSLWFRMLKYKVRKSLGIIVHPE